MIFPNPMLYLAESKSPQTADAPMGGLTNEWEGGADVAARFTATPPHCRFLIVSVSNGMPSPCDGGEAPNHMLCVQRHYHVCGSTSHDKSSASKEGKLRTFT